MKKFSHSSPITVARARRLCHLTNARSGCLSQAYIIITHLCNWCLSFFIFFFADTVCATDGVVEITYVSGAVEICNASGTCSQAIEGSNLHAGDTVKTNQDSCVELSFDEANKNIVRINSDTEVELLLKENEKIKLSKGEIFSSINELPSGSVFEIRTLTAVAGVRGTEWLTKASEETTDIEAFEGTPYVKGIASDGRVLSQETRILAGHMATIKKFGRPSALKRLPGRNLKRWRTLRAEVKKHKQNFIIKKKNFPKSGKGPSVLVPKPKGKKIPLKFRR